MRHRGPLGGCDDTEGQRGQGRGCHWRGRWGSQGMAARPRTTSPLPPNCSASLFWPQQPQGSLETQRQTCPHPISGSVASLSLQDPTPSPGGPHPGSLSPAVPLAPHRPHWPPCCCRSTAGSVPLYLLLPPPPESTAANTKGLLRLLQGFVQSGTQKGGPSRQRGPTGEAGQTQPGPVARSVSADTLTDQARSPASKVRWCRARSPPAGQL